LRRARIRHGAVLPNRNRLGWKTEVSLDVGLDLVEDVKLHEAVPHLAHLHDVANGGWVPHMVDLDNLGHLDPPGEEFSKRVDILAREQGGEEPRRLEEVAALTEALSNDVDRGRVKAHRHVLRPQQPSVGRHKREQFSADERDRSRHRRWSRSAAYARLTSRGSACM
jgi:hypothetical protein